MKTKFLLVCIATAVLAASCSDKCEKDHGTCTQSDPDITISFAGGLSEYGEDMLVGSKVTVRADITSTVGLDNIIIFKLYKNAKDVIESPIQVPLSEANNYELSYEVEITDYEYTYEFKGVSIVAFNKDGGAFSASFNCTGETKDDPNYFFASNMWLQNFFDGTWTGGYTPSGLNYMTTSILRSPVSNYTIASANPSLIDFFSIGDVDESFGTTEDEGNFPYGLMSPTCPNKPKTMKAYGLENLTGLQSAWFKRLTTDAAIFNAVMDGTMTLENGVITTLAATGLTGGNFPLSQSEIWINPGTIFLVKFGDMLNPVDLLTGNSDAVTNFESSRWGMFRVDANWDSTGGTPSGRPPLIDQTMDIDVYFQKPANAGLSLAALMTALGL